MPLTTVTVSISTQQVLGTALPRGRVTFRLTGPDVDGALVVPTAVSVRLDANGEGSVQLWPNSRGTNGTQYTVVVQSENGAQLQSAVATVPVTACNLHDIIGLSPPASVDTATAKAAAAAASASEAQTWMQLARDWASKITAAVADGLFSAREYAAGSQAGTGGSAKNWAQQTGGDVTGAAANSRSAKAWSQDDLKGATLGGSARDWALTTSSTVDGTFYSSKEYAHGTQLATGGSAMNWAQQTGADVTGAAGGSRSARSWAQDSLVGVTYGGSAKDWAQSASKPDGTNESAKTYASQAGTHSTNAGLQAAAAAGSATQGQGYALTAVAAAAIATTMAASAAASANTNLEALSYEGIHHSPNAIVSAFIEDSTRDYDGGAHLSRMGLPSWMRETLNGNWLGIQFSELNAWLENATNVVLGANVAPALSAMTESGTSWNYSGGVWTISTSSSLSTDYLILSNAGLTVGTLYKVSITATGHVAGTATIRHASTSTALADAPPINRDGTKTFYFVATTTSLYLRQVSNSAGMSISACTIEPVTSIGGFSSPGDFFQLAGDGRHYALNRNVLKNTAWSGATAGTYGAGAVLPTDWTGVASTGAFSFSTSTTRTGNAVRFTASGAERPAWNQAVTVSAGITVIHSFYVETVHSGTVTIQSIAGGSTGPAGLTTTYRKNGSAAAAGDSVANGDFIEVIFTGMTANGTLQMRYGLGANAATVGDVTLSPPQLEWAVSTSATASTYVAKSTSDAGYTATDTGNRSDKPRQILWLFEANYVAGYDITRPGSPLWKSVRTTSGSTALGTSSTTATIVGGTAKDGLLIVWTSNAGAVVFDWQRDLWIPVASTLTARGLDQRISKRNSQTTFGTPAVYYTVPGTSIVQADIYTHRDAPVDPVLGRPAPYLLFTCSSTSGALLVRDGREITLTTGAGLQCGGFTKRGDLYFGRSSDQVYVLPLPSSTTTINTDPALRTYGQTNGSLRIPTGTGKNVTPAGDVLAVRTGSGSNVLALLRENPSTPSAGLMAWISSTYNTGWMCGDIKRVYLSGIDAGTASGTERVSNGTFPDTTGWTAGSATTMSAASNELVLSATGSTNYPQARTSLGTLTAGQSYTVVISARRTAGTGALRAAINTTNAGTAAQPSTPWILDTTTTPQTGTVVQFTATTTGEHWLHLFGQDGAAPEYRFGPVSVKECSPDRSYNGASGTVYGTLAKTAVATAAQLVFWSGWSASNYVQEAYSSALDYASQWTAAAFFNTVTPSVGSNGPAPGGVGPAVSYLPLANFPATAVTSDMTTAQWTKGTGWSGTGATAFSLDGSQGSSTSDLTMASGNTPTTGTVRKWTLTITSLTLNGGTLTFNPNDASNQAGITQTGTYTGLGMGTFCRIRSFGAGIVCTGTLTIEELDIACIADRSAATGANWQFGINALGYLVGRAHDGTNGRTVVSTTPYLTQTNKVRVSYTTDGTLTLSVRGRPVATATGTPLATLANASAVFTIGNRRALDAPFPGSIALVKTGATVPTQPQAEWMFHQERAMFTAGAQVCIPDSGALVDFFYDDELGRLQLVTAANRFAFNGLVRVESDDVNTSTNLRVTGRSGMLVTARANATGSAPNVELSRPSQAIREELMRRAEEANAQRITVPRDLDYVGGFTATVTNGSSQLSAIGSTLVRGSSGVYPATVDLTGAVVTNANLPASTRLLQIESATAARVSANGTGTAVGANVLFKTIPLPVGMEAIGVFVDGLKRTEGSTKYWQRLFDGFQETIQFTTEPGVSAAINVATRRMQ